MSSRHPVDPPQEDRAFSPMPLIGLVITACAAVLLFRDQAQGATENWLGYLGVGLVGIAVLAAGLIWDTRERP